MTIKFYQNTGDPRDLNRKFTNVLYTTTAIPFESMTVTRPSLILEYNSTIANCNYFEIPELGRIYRVTSCTLQNGSRCVVTGEVDVLATYRDRIRDLEVHVEINQVEEAAFIPDTNQGFTNSAFIDSIPGDRALLNTMPNDGSSNDIIYTYVLGTIGKS